MVDQGSSIPARRSLNWLLYILAKQYIDSANILEAKIRETKNADPAPAIIMCLSFSIELILKCLLIVDRDEIRTKEDMEAAGIDRRGHDYIDLFDRIAPHYQEIVLKHLSARDPSIRDLESLRDFLKAAGSDPFVLWRYVYEHDAPPVFQLNAYKRFGGALWDAINEIRGKKAR